MKGKWRLGAALGRLVARVIENYDAVIPAKAHRRKEKGFRTFRRDGAPWRNIVALEGDAPHVGAWARELPQIGGALAIR